MNIIALLDKVKRQSVRFSFSPLIVVEPIGLLRFVNRPPSHSSCHLCTRGGRRTDRSCGINITNHVEVVAAFVTNPR